MALQDKYKELTDAAKAAGINNLQVREQNNVLYIDGSAPSGAVYITKLTLITEAAILYLILMHLLQQAPKRRLTQKHLT